MSDDPRSGRDRRARIGNALSAAWLVVATALVAPSAARAGAWVQESGTAWVRWSAGILETRRRFDGNGDTIPFDTAGGFRDTGFRDLTTSLYAEIGIHRDWTLIADATWKDLEASQPSAVFSTWGTGDARLGVRRALRRDGPVVLAATALATVPTGYDEAEYPALGSGRADVAIGIEAGVAGRAGWTVAEGFWRARAGPFRDQVGGAVGGGLDLTRGIALRAEARGFAPVGRARNQDAMRFDPAAADPAQLDLAGTVSVGIGGGLAVEAEARGTAFGENTLAGTRWSLGLATRPAIRLAGRGR